MGSYGILGKRHGQEMKAGVRIILSEHFIQMGIKLVGNG
jgi:hypothetical protein